MRCFYCAGQQEYVPFYGCMQVGRRMEACILRTREHLQILQAVIQLVAIDVGHRLVL